MAERQTGLFLFLQAELVTRSFSHSVLDSLIQSLVRLGRRLGCYRITLDCKDTVVKFYANNGFSLEPGSANSMSLRFPPAAPSPES
ncbi:hypothetical protein HPB48_020522 [Haemaphysalis longicornis]|uniref:Glucosamine 6-phosphate N-acetyltransferase n=1 Tax=Haemaphysalis longicornis TaxID=44386 RepID=A0A9J6GJN6_HAELO|nr:hypothetical protein HPB48_020522 [Haemaphysalis longicornis]